MPNFLDFRHFSVAYKMAISSVLILLFLLIIVILNNSQLKSMGYEVTIITSKEAPTISAVHKLDLLLYQQTILRLQIFNKNRNGIKVEDDIVRYNDLSLQITQTHQMLNDLMKEYSKLEMPSNKRRWVRLQNEHQQALQLSLDNIKTTFSTHEKLTQAKFLTLSESEILETTDFEIQASELNNKIHQEISVLTTAAYNGITSSGNKIGNIEYGARQLTYFLLFWFYLIGIAVTVVIIKMISSRLKIASDFAKKMANGDECANLEVKNNDELGQLMQSLNDSASLIRNNQK